MKFILTILMAIILFSCKDDMVGHLKYGTIVTMKGDTITFYGGCLTYSAFGERSIRNVVIEEKGN
mgnify:CR=1 FL=1